MMRTACLLIPALLTALSPSASSGEQVKLLTGFEKDDLLKWGYIEQGDVLVTKKAVEHKKIGWIKGQFPRGYRKGDCTEGQMALFRHFSEKVARWYLASGKSPEEVLYMQGTVLNTHARFRQMMAHDWSAYERLRLDVKSTACGIRLQVMLEDEMIAPHVTRFYEVPEGKWVTLEFDLAKASKLREVPLGKTNARRLGGEVLKARLIDLARMANIRLVCHRASRETTVLVDNLRLLAPGAKDPSKLDILTDLRPFPAPGELGFQEKPQRSEPASGKRARGPLERGTAVQAGLNQSGSRGMMSLPRGVAVADNDRILFIGSIGRIRAAQSIDGGKTWTDLSGKKDSMTACQHSANAPGNVAIGDGEDGYVFYTARCSGGSGINDIYFRHLKFDGKGWRLGEPRLVDTDVRHCPEFKMRALRLPDGRIWVVWKHYDRFGKNYLRARYSDDEGMTWPTVDSNGLISFRRRRDPRAYPLPVTWWQETPEGWEPPAEGRSGIVAGSRGFHPHGSLALVRYGESVGCLYATGRHTAWTWFDAKKGEWTAPVVASKVWQGPVSAVTAGREQVWFSLAKSGSLVRLKRGQWVEDSPPGHPGGGVLSVAGETLLCFWKERKNGKTPIRAARKPAGGGWSQP
ncbi:hypothetical protein LCGC14_1977710, partial [marine sediment metagenome]